MVNCDLIAKIKASTLAIGIVDDANPLYPLFIGGSGFLISDDGFFLTASHVVENLNSLLPHYKENYPNARIVAIQNVVKKTGKIAEIHTNIAIIMKPIHLKASPNSKYQSDFNLDIAICRLYGEQENLEFLEIKKTSEFKILDEVLMCGYPKNTLSMKQGWFGTTRTSPILQLGRIATIFPYDGTIEPEGIQTDIIGTGGSSGSPIVDAVDGKVVAIAQSVLAVAVTKTEITDDNGTKKWTAKDVGRGDTGLTYGITMFFIHSVIFQLIDEFKKEFYANGKIKPEFAKPPRQFEHRI